MKSFSTLADCFWNKLSLINFQCRIDWQRIQILRELNYINQETVLNDWLYIKVVVLEKNASCNDMSQRSKDTHICT